MYTKKLTENIENDLKNISANGKYKTERMIEGAQGARVIVGGREMLMFASNNYLGLANDPELIKSAKEGLEKFGFGMASVRFLSGTQTIHRELEKKIAEFIGTEDAIVYSTNFIANFVFFFCPLNVGGQVRQAPFQAYRK